MILNLLLEIVQSLICTDFRLLLPVVTLSFCEETAITNSQGNTIIVLKSSKLLAGIVFSNEDWKQGCVQVYYYNHLQLKYGSCRSMRHWNPVVSPLPVNSTVTLLFLPTIACPLIPTTMQNLESLRTRSLFRMTALSFLTGSTATTRSTWSPAGRPVRLKKPEVPGVGG